MKLSNFVLIKTKGNSALDKEFFAEVDITTGILWWKKTKRIEIRREYGGFWYRVDSGKYTPGFQAENLFRSWEAKK